MSSLTVVGLALMFTLPNSYKIKYIRPTVCKSKVEKLAS